MQPLSSTLTIFCVCKQFLFFFLKNPFLCFLHRFVHSIHDIMILYRSTIKTTSSFAITAVMVLEPLCGINFIYVYHAFASVLCSVSFIPLCGTYFSSIHSILMYMNQHLSLWFLSIVIVVSIYVVPSRID